MYDLDLEGRHDKEGRKRREGSTLMLSLLPRLVGCFIGRKPAMLCGSEEEEMGSNARGMAPRHTLSSVRFFVCWTGRPTRLTIPNLAAIPARLVAQGSYPTLAHSLTHVRSDRQAPVLLR